ncbi:VOC family protein [Bacillus sp. FDAARGOS_1420]|nr:VOC family protein [Bacillus sp. FDAARGOS_1420]
MQIRLELFVADLQKSIQFYEEILGFNFFNKTEKSAVMRLNDFALLLTPDYILHKDHYLRKGGLTPKGKGIEIIVAVQNVEQIYEHVLERDYLIESALQPQPWGMRDFRLSDPDGYYLRITS